MREIVQLLTGLDGHTYRHSIVPMVLIVAQRLLVNLYKYERTEPYPEKYNTLFVGAPLGRLLNMRQTKQRSLLPSWMHNWIIIYSGLYVSNVQTKFVLLYLPPLSYLSSFVLSNVLILCDYYICNSSLAFEAGSCCGKLVDGGIFHALCFDIRFGIVIAFVWLDIYALNVVGECSFFCHWGSHSDIPHTFK